MVVWTENRMLKAELSHFIYCVITISIFSHNSFNLKQIPAFSINENSVASENT